MVFENFSDLKFKNLIIWIVQLFDLIQKNIELKFKFSSDNWICFYSVIWIDFKKELSGKKFNSVQKLNYWNILYWTE